MKHDYTPKEIRHAWNHRKYLSGQTKTEANLIAFLDALPTRSAEPTKSSQPWPGQQEAIDAAMIEAARLHPACIGSLVADPKFFSLLWAKEAPARLAIAQAYDAARPQAAEIAKLKAELAEAQQITESWSNHIHPATHDSIVSAKDKEIAALKAELAALRTPTQSAEPLLADDGRSLGQVCREHYCEALGLTTTWQHLREEVRMAEEAASQAVAAVVLAQAVRRMEAVPVEELCDAYEAAYTSYGGMGAVRARLIAAAKGEGQTMTKNVPGDKCPACGAEEVESNTPNTTYACGSSDYDGRPDTFHPGDKCEAKPVVVNEPPKNEEQPDLSGESEKQDPYARLKAYAKAGARIRTHDMEWTNDVDWSWCLRPEHYEVHPDDLHMCPEYAPQAEAQPTTFPGWTPAVGDTVRLKSGGPVMTVHHIAKDGSLGCLHNANGPCEFATLPTACLTPAQP